MKLHLQADRSLIRSRSSSIRYVMASITAPIAPPRATRIPVNVALVLDRSGSMAGENKFPLAVKAVEESLRLLRSEDRFSLVVFDAEVDVLTPATRATPDAKKRALRALAQIAPRGSTDLCAGWMHGCEQLAEGTEPGVITRVLLLTDGQANHGEVNRDVLAHHAAELRLRGISTSTFGVGADFDERLLRDMAHEGGGNTYFIQSSQQILDLITSELGEALEVVVPRATCTLILPRGVEGRVLNSFRSHRSQGRTGLTIELGDLVSGQELNVVVRLRFPLGAVGEKMEINAKVNADAVETLTAQPEVIAFTYADHDANDEQSRNREVDREVARMYSARAHAEATEANRIGDFDRARRALIETARRIREYAGDDEELLTIATELRAGTQAYERIMEPMAMKMAFYAAESYTKGRNPEGRAKRG